MRYFAVQALIPERGTPRASLWDALRVIEEAGGQQIGARPFLPPAPKPASQLPAARNGKGGRKPGGHAGLVRAAILAWTDERITVAGIRAMLPDVNPHAIRNAFANLKKSGAIKRIDKATYRKTKAGERIQMATDEVTA